MFNWDTLLDETALASVFPNEYARFARPIREGLLVFLEGLPPHHQAEILAQQESLALTASFSERLTTLARCCPVLHKLGQVLARDQRIAPDLRRHLRGLESLSPSVSDATIADVLVRELGPLERRGIQLMPPAIAEASVAVVIPFIQSHREHPAGQQRGVFKVLKPGIEERLELELELLGRVGSHLDERCEALQIPHLDYEELFEQIREKLCHEVRLDQEQRHLAKAASFFADEPLVHIPELIDHCTPRVTAMERITGGKVTDHSLVSRCAQRRLATLIIRALIARPIFSPASQAMFHGDPHAGNLFLTDENRLGILDWSLVGSLGERERVAMSQIILGAATLDLELIVAVLTSLNDRQEVDRPTLLAVVGSCLKRIRQGTRPGLSWLIGLLDDAVHTARLRVATDLMLFRKSLHTLEGVIAETAGEATSIDDVLLVDFLGHFASEWPHRWSAHPNSRQFATRLSNLDLTNTLLSYPSTVARFWMEHGFDAMDACCLGDKLRN